MLRRLLAILLLAVFGLPIVSSSLALGQGAEAGLPACCRRVGQHHCAMTMGERAEAVAGTQEKAWRTPAETCPYCPASVVAAHRDSPGLPLAAVGFAHAASVMVQVRAAECVWRVARERARQTRGPPRMFVLV